MSTLNHLVQTPFAKALGWTIFHTLWEGAVVAGTLFAALLGIRSARVRYAAACAAMLSLVAGFAVTLFVLWPGRSADANAVLAALPSAAQGGSQWVNATSARWRADDILAWLTPFWILGVAFFHLRGLTSWLAARRLRGRGVCRVSDDWQARLAGLRKRVHVSKLVILLESSLADVPAVVGWLRPAILMPVGLLAGMPVGQVEAILLHELAHIRRDDYLVNVLQTVVESLLFYHPVVWWITGIMREERENCCDDVVVAASGDVREYVTALTALEQNRWAAGEVALAANGGSLVKRVRRLLGLLSEREGFRAVLSPYLFAGILLFTGAMALTAWQTKAPVQNPSVSKVAWWQQWLGEDVIYIIQDQERNAFLDLSTDEERRYFVEQFWQRRNPTPGSSENAFKNEHYRRLGFASGRFASRSAPGWKTDRGRIYITFGPPDEIDSHPTGQALPYEDWSYRRIEAIGSNVNMRFVDKDGSGEFHMTMDPNPSGAAQRVERR